MAVPGSHRAKRLVRRLSAQSVVLKGRPTRTFFVFSQAASRVVDETLRIDEVNLSTGLLLRHALESKETHQLRSDTDTCGTCTEEKDSVIRQRPSRSRRRKFGCIQEATQDNSASALDVVIKERVFPSVPLKVFERIVS